MVISTACSSSAKVFAAAQRYIDAGLCDAALVGGVDSLCLTTLYGFNSLQLVSEQPCRPSDARRNGLSLGEAAGFTLLMRASDDDRGDVQLCGYGESSDAYHMSSPHPDGLGAQLAMQSALDRAGLSARDIDYINLHGTATPANDLAEGKAIAAMFGSDTPCSSTKGWIGHTLGAAGISEALFSLLAIRHGFLPQSLNTEQPDPAIPCRILTAREDRAPRRVLSNSFGFGGTNCSLILGARDA
jgi:3-oxoacyl-[acyl-carrier-protein] synthase-1